MLELADRLRLTTWLDDAVAMMSYGTRQKLGVLLALLGEPALIVLDETFNGLDPASRLLLKRHLRARVDAGRVGILLATHALDIAEHWADRVALLHEGGIAHTWSRGELLALRAERDGGLEAALAQRLAESTAAREALRIARAVSDLTRCLTSPTAAPSMASMDVLNTTAFEPRATVPPLAADEIHVWFLAVDAECGPREIGAATRTALERLLCAYANRARPPAIERGVHGKPFAPELPELDFNLSHAGPHVLLAFARGQAIGIDLERCDRRLSLDDIARRFFAASEAQGLARLPPATQRATFLRLWTHKEAVLKAIGAGLNFGLDRVEFALDRDSEVGALLHIAAEAGSASEWNLHRIDPAPGLVGALAWRGAARSVRTFTLAS